MKKGADISDIKVKKGDLVKIEYVASLRNGVIFDTSIGFEADNCGIIDSEREYNPMEFIIGSSIIPGLDKALVGMTINESKTFVIKPQEAFGLKDEKKIREMPISFLRNKEPIIGEHLVIKDEKNDVVSCYVKEIRNDTLVLDLNHPLAGEDIIMNVKVLAINGKPTGKLSSEEKELDSKEKELERGLESGDMTKKFY